MSAAATRPAISAAMVDGEKPPCSSQRSDPKLGPWLMAKSAARLMCSRVEGSVGEAGLPGHQDRVGDLVELDAEAVRGELAVDQAVARHRAVGELLALEQEPHRVPGGGPVAGQHEPGEGLVQVAGEHLAVGAEVGVVGVAGRDRLPPGRGQAGHHRPGEGLVLGGLEHVRAQVVDAAQLAGGGVAEPGEARRRRDEPGVVADPAGGVADQGAAEPGLQRGPGGADRLALGGPEPDGQGEVAAGGQVDPGRLHQVALGGVGVGGGQGVVAVELGQPVAGGAGEAVADLGERPGGVEGDVDRLGVVPVGGVGRGHRVGGDRHGMTGGGVDGAGVGAAVAAPAAAVAVHGGIEAEVEAEVAGGQRLEPDPHAAGRRGPGR